LAGSERSAKVGSTGQTFLEGNNINKSLTTLGKCIRALVDITRGKKVLPPFRESVLTLYLRESLAGTFLTTMLANVSPVASNLEETLSTLRYAASVKNIKTVVKKNEDPSQQRIRELTEENATLKRELELSRQQANVARRLAQHIRERTPQHGSGAASSIDAAAFEEGSAGGVSSHHGFSLDDKTLTESRGGKGKGSKGRGGKGRGAKGKGGKGDMGRGLPSSITDGTEERVFSTAL